MAVAAARSGALRRTGAAEQSVLRDQQSRPTPTRPTPPRFTPRSDCPMRHSPPTLSARAAVASPPGGPPPPPADWPLTADVRVGRPGSADERLGGDGAAALLFGDGPAIADVLATTSHTAEFLDRWRSPRSVTGEQWEERFGADRYAALIRTAVDGSSTQTGLVEVDHVVVACPNSAIVKRVATLVKALKSTRHLTGRVLRGRRRRDRAWRRCSTSPNPTRRSWSCRRSTAVTRCCCAPPTQLPLRRQAIPVSAAARRGHRSPAPDLPVVARTGRTRTAAPSRAGPAGRAARCARRGMEVRAHRNTLPAMRIRAPAARCACAGAAGPPTRWTPHRWRRCAAPSSPTPSTTWPTRRRRR